MLIWYFSNSWDWVFLTAIIITLDFTCIFIIFVNDLLKRAIWKSTDVVGTNKNCSSILDNVETIKFIDQES